MQLGRLVGLDMYGTASLGNHQIVSDLGATPIEYKNTDFAEEIHRLTGDGVDIVFDGVGEANVWRSFQSLRPRGRVVVYGFTSFLQKVSWQEACGIGFAVSCGRRGTRSALWFHPADGAFSPTASST